MNHAMVGHLYAEHYGWLLGWLWRRLGSSERAADFAQDAFCRLLSVPDISVVRQPRAFLTTTARRLIIDDARRHKVEAAWLDVCRQLNLAGAIAPPAESHLEVIETLTAIVHMLEGLPANTRAAFLMNRLDGMGYAEIAKELGISLRTVKAYMARTLMHCYAIVYADQGRAD